MVPFIRSCHTCIGWMSNKLDYKAMASAARKSKKECDIRHLPRILVPAQKNRSKSWRNEAVRMQGGPEFFSCCGESQECAELSDLKRFK